MPNPILSTFSDPVAVPDLILDGLVNSRLTGYSSSLVDNRSTGYRRIYINFLIGLDGYAITRPVNGIRFYVIRAANGDRLISDYGMGSDGVATLTPPMAPPDHIFIPQGDNVGELGIQNSFIIENPGPFWGLFVINSTGAPLASPNYVTWVGEYPAIQ